MKADSEYWVERLGGAPPTLDLPTDRLRSSARARSTASAIASLVAGPAPDDAALTAAWATLLARHAGQSEVVIGVPARGALAMMPVRCDVSDDPTLPELARRVAMAIRDGREHLGVTFEELVAIVGEGPAGRAPILQTMCGDAKPPAALDLSLTVHRSSSPSTTIELTYDASLFEHARMVDMLAQLQGLLAQAADAPDTPVMAMSLVSEAARSVLPDPTAPLGDTWHGAVSTVFADVAAAHPERLAVRDPNETWTYGELEERSNQLAHHLLDAGCVRGDRVAIIAHRSASLAWAVLGVLKAGTAFVMVDPSYPGARIIATLQAAKPRAVLRVADGAPLDAGVDAWLATADLLVREELPGKSHATALFASARKTRPEVTLGPDDLAYVAFTSGSTGRPKGVLGRHGPLSHFQPWRVREFRLVPDDRISMLSGLAHDPLHRDLFTPLQLGASLHVPEADALRVPGQLARWMATEGITVAHMTPQFAQLLSPSGAGTERLDALRRVFLVGDALKRADVEQLRRVAPNALCVNYYGATETQQALSYHVVDDDADGGATMALGRGTPDVQLLVVAGKGQLAGLGELGELYFRSPHLSAGYLDDEELTRARFLPNPFRVAAGDRVYRTGDLGRYRAGGVVEFAGRADRQVKVRGFRVELGDVETVLASHPSVREVAVEVRPGPTGEGRLVGYVTRRGAAEPTPEELRAFIVGHLPDYMAPSAFVVLDALPLTPNGKLDRRSLPPPSTAPRSAPVSVSSPLEAMIADIFARVLRVEHVGAHDDFFALGGHSLLAMQVVARLRDATERELSVALLFEASTPATLAARMANADAELAPPHVTATQDDASAAISFVQSSILAWERKRAPSTTWSAAVRLRVRGPLDRDVLGEAVTRLLTRQDALRRTFDVRGEVVTVGLASAEQPVTLVRAPDSGEDLDAWVDRFCDEQGNSVPFVLDGSPLVRFFVLERAHDEHVVLMTWHQLVNDPSSDRMTGEELFAHYTAVTQGAAAQAKAPPPPIRYVDYAAWERAWFDGDGQGRIAAARARLEAVRPLSIGDHDLPIGTAAHDRKFRLDEAQSTALNRLCASVDASPFMVMAATLSIVLARWSGHDEIPIMAPVSLRNARSELDGVMGRFLNWIPIVVPTAGDPTVGELITRARRAILDAYANDRAPAARVFGTEDVFEHPLNRVLLNMQTAEDAALAMISTCDLVVQQEEIALRSGARNALAFFFGVTGSTFYVGARGAAHAFLPSTIADKVDEVRACLLSLDPALPISRIG